MDDKEGRFTHWYTGWVLGRPILTIAILSLVIGLLIYQSRNFRIDASTETLLLENDLDLRYAREVYARYGIQDFLLIAFTPKSGDLLDSANLATVTKLRDSLSQLESVESVLTILDVPLLESPPISFKELLKKEIPYLESSRVDKKLAKKELSGSPFYGDLLVSRDAITTAIIVNLKIDPTYSELTSARNALLNKKLDGALSPSEYEEYARLVDEIRTQQISLNKQQHENIEAVRAIMAAHRDSGQLYLGGVSMIADDMITYIKNDLRIFGLGVFLMLVLMLGLFFRSKRWVILPMLCCFLSVIAMLGVLGTFGWDVTVISSNFISLQLIITLAISVHLIVRFREYQLLLPEVDHRTLLSKTIQSKFIPCLFAVLTTIAGFTSLMLSNIKPVIHFGWMMSIGILISLALTFVLFPAAAMLLKKPAPPSQGRLINFSLTAFLGRLTETYGTVILIVTALFTVVTIMGVSKLRVENSFIDYFKQSTEIYQGMKIIDQKLGGTTPLDVIIQFETFEEEKGEDEEFEEFPIEEDFFINSIDGASDDDPGKYWFMDHRLEIIEKVHDYLETRPEIGKVLSLGTLLKIGRQLNNGKSLDSIDMALLYSKLPEEYEELLLSPYVSFEKNEARFTVRIIDSLEGLQRNLLLEEIKHDLVQQLELEESKVTLSGAMVLYNNMLQSLFASQIMTLGVVALALLIMFLFLFRSLKIALIALFPNLLSAGAVLGVMGWLDIPLDMMTITIAAISIGIAVDNTIHYIHRFREEIERDGDYYDSLHRAHNSVGYAMYYTSMIIIVGFSILILSNFWPTIYFGLFTGLAMLIALIASLTLLPQLLVWIKPFNSKNHA
ncbi:MAG: RND family transporter [Desulfofustis sp.]|nr:RND family transporter [Desulfofustis sp.]